MPSVEQNMQRCRKAMKEIMDREGTNPTEWERNAGIGRATVLKFVNAADRDIGLRTLLKLADVYRLTLAEIVGEK